MVELTRTLTLELTVHTEVEEVDNVTDENKRELEAVLKNLWGVDHVYITKVQDFVNEIPADKVKSKEDIKENIKENIKEGVTDATDGI